MRKLFRITLTVIFLLLYFSVYSYTGEEHDAGFDDLFLVSDEDGGTHSSSSLPTEDSNESVIAGRSQATSNETDYKPEQYSSNQENNNQSDGTSEGQLSDIETTSASLGSSNIPNSGQNQQTSVLNVGSSGDMNSGASVSKPNTEISGGIEVPELLDESKVRAQIQALFSRGVSEYTEKKLKNSITTFNEVNFITNKAISKFPGSSNYYNRITRSAHNYIGNAQRAMSAVLEYRQAVQAFRNKKYKTCISHIDSFLRHDLENIDLGEYIARAIVLQQEALARLRQNSQTNLPETSTQSSILETNSDSELKKTILSLCREAKNYYNAMEFQDALNLYKSALSKNPKNAGLAEIEPKIEERIALIEKTLSLKEYAQSKLAEASSLYVNKQYDASKSALKELYLKLKNSQIPGYFSEEFARMRQILAKLKQAATSSPVSSGQSGNTEVQSAMSISFTNFSAQQKKIAGTNVVCVNGSYTISGLKTDEKYNFVVNIKGKWGDNTTLSEGKIGNGNYKFKYNFRLPDNFRAGVELVTATILCTENQLSKTRSDTVVLVRGDNSDVSGLLGFLASDPDKNSETDSETESDSERVDESNVTTDDSYETDTQAESDSEHVDGSNVNIDDSSLASDTEENQPEQDVELIKVNIYNIHLNQDSYRPDESLTLRVNFAVKNAKKNTTFTVFGKIEGIGNFVRNLTLGNGKHYTTFQFKVPNLSENSRPIQLKIKWEQNDEEFQVIYKRRKEWRVSLPKIFSAVIYLTPKVLTPGCKVEFNAEINIKYFKPNSNVKLMAKFQSALFKVQPPLKYITISTGKYTGSERKEFKIKYRVPSDIELGTYKITVQAKAKQGKYLVGPKIAEKEFIVQKYSYTVYKHLIKSSGREYLSFSSYDIKNMNSKYERKYVLKRYLRSENEAIRYILQKIKNIRRDSNGNYYGYGYRNKKYYIHSKIANFGKKNRN